LFAVRNLNNDNLREESAYVYLAVLEGFTCPLEVTLQCSADKKVWEPLVYANQPLPLPGLGCTYENH